MAAGGLSAGSGGVWAGGFSNATVTASDRGFASEPTPEPSPNPLVELIVADTAASFWMTTMRSASNPLPVAVQRPVMLRTDTGSEAVAVVPLLSVAVAVTVKSPVFLKTWAGVTPLAASPSPNVQA